MAGSGLLARSLRQCLDWHESLHGPVYARRNQKRDLARGRSIIEGLEQIRLRWPGVESTEKVSPIFILSAGWRSGSTMMQRLIMSEQEILIWGEPYSHAMIIRHLADGVSAITSSWPEDNWFIDQYDLDDICNTFVANMYPAVQELQNACLSYVKTLLDEPARKRGFARWGLKEVRLDIEDAYFLKWLFPRARFVFVCRNPYHAYLSYRTDRSWYREWPDKPAFTAAKFGEHWDHLVSGFHKGARQLGGMFLRYEDVINGDADFSAIEDYLDLKLNPSLLEKKVGSHGKGDARIPVIELKQIRKKVRHMADLLGYEV